MVSLVSSLGRAPRNPRFPYVLFLLAKKPSIRPIICCKFYKYEEKKFIDQNRSLFGKNFSSDTSPLSISIVPFVTKKMAKETFKNATLIVAFVAGNYHFTVFNSNYETRFTL